MNTSWEDKESADLSSISQDGARRRWTSQSRTRENSKPSPSPAQPPEQSHETDKQGRQDENTPGMSRYGSVFDPEHEEEHYIRKPRSRKGSSSYAASTKASQARQNEKLDITGGTGNTRQRAFSNLDTRRVSPVQRSHTASKNSKGASSASDYLPESPWEQKDEARQMQHYGPDSTDFRTIGSHDNEHVAEILRGWKQEAEEGPMTNENARFEKEELKGRLRELETERDKAANIRGHLQLQLKISKKEAVNLRKQNSELEAKIRQSTTASVESEGQAETELRVRESEAENWKLKHDNLAAKIQELEEEIEARNRIESRLPLMEAVQAENESLQVANAKMQMKLEQTQKQLDGISEYAKERDNEILECDRKLGTFRSFLYKMNEVMTNWIQASSHESRVEVSEMDSLVRICADDAETKKLLVSTQRLLEKVVHKHEILESRLEDKDYEIENIKKGMKERIEEIEEAVQGTPGLTSSSLLTASLSTSALSTPGLSTSSLLTSGSMRPPGLLQHDREGFKGLYEEEMEKRKAAEKKVQDIGVAKKQQLRLQQAKKELQLRLNKVLEENNILRKEAEEAKLQADLWRDETKQSKLELDHRSTEFQSCIDRNEEEKDRYIKYYHAEVQDASRWAAVSLHKKLEDQEQEYKTLKQEFDRSKAIIAHRQGEIASLEKKCMIQSKHISDVEQAIMHNEELPILQNLYGNEEDGSEYGSELHTFSPLSPLTPSTHPSHPANRRLKPRYEHPTAVATRLAKLEAYRAELEARTEEELLDFIFNPPSTTVKRGKRPDDIIEKVRNWSLGGKYPPVQEEWKKIRSMSVWERWQGEKWMVRCTEKRFVEVLKNRGLLEYC